MTFLDQHGHERHDVTMLDPGASAFLCGYGPFRRYLDYLKACNFPVETVEFNRCCRKFCFGGDGESWSHWVVRLPMSITGKHGRAQVFLIKGETPLLCGRPIIEALGLVIDFSQRKMRFQDGPWTQATLGYHGEYLLPLWEPYDDDYPYTTILTFFTSTFCWLVMEKLTQMPSPWSSLMVKSTSSPRMIELRFNLLPFLMEADPYNVISFRLLTRSCMSFTTTTTATSPPSCTLLER